MEYVQIYFDSRFLVGYTLQKENKEEEEIIYHLFRDYNDSDSVFVSRTPFSRRKKDLVAFTRNWTDAWLDDCNWRVSIQRYNGQIDFVRDGNVRGRFRKRDRRIGECLNYG